LVDPTLHSYVLTINLLFLFSGYFPLSSALLQPINNNEILSYNSSIHNRVRKNKFVIFPIPVALVQILTAVHKFQEVQMQVQATT